MPSKAKNQEISKRHDTNLWAEIRTLYESKQGHTFEKIKNILTLEFALESFPSKSTIIRRAKKENWKRHVSEGDIKKFNGTFDTEFWLCVRAVYEGNGKLKYTQLRELVQNELQCDTFPSQQAVSAMAKREGWKALEGIVIKSDTELKKFVRSVNKLSEQSTNIIVKEKNKNKKDDEYEYDEDEEPEEDAFEALDFELMSKQIEIEKSAIKNLLMTSQIRRKDMTEIILKARKRMMTINDAADQIADRLMLNNALLLSKEFRQVCGSEAVEYIANEMKHLSRVAATFNELSFNRRESIKFELSLFGVTIEDLQKAGTVVKVVDLNDNTAYEAQRARLEKERERIAERRRYIESGGLQKDVDAIVKERMAAANMDDEDDAEFEEIE